MFDHVELVEQCRKAAGDDVALWSDADLLAAALSVEDAARALAASSGHLLAELDTRGTCFAELGMSTAHWLSYHRNEPHSTTRRRVRTATLLHDRLDHVDQALADGRIGTAHVDVFARAANPRIIDEIARLQTELVDLAQVTTYERFAAETMGLSRQLDQDGGHDPDRDQARNRLRIRPTHTGTHRLDGELLDELGASLKEALDTRADRLHRQFTRDHETSSGAIAIPSRATLMALALAELAREGVAADPTTTTAPATDLTLVLHDTDPGQVRTLDGHRLDRHDLDHRICDAVVSFLSMNDTGVPLTLSREQRLANRAQRRANHARDGGCVFPGCNAPASWTDQHHVTWWENGGPTDTSNLASLCRRHHGITHRTGWHMHTTPDQWFWWQTPTGHTFWSQRHGQQRAGPIPTG